ncbi:MAG: Bax inhibitor-1 family protein, partial [Actinomycetota bacterium]
LALAITEFVTGTSWLLILGGFMVVSWIANSMGLRAQTPGAQYGAYALLIVANAVLFATPLYLAAYAEGMPEGVISTAAQISLFAFAGLSFIAIRSGKDFSFLRGILMWGGILALVAIVAAVIFGTGLGTWFSVAMIGFAGAAILYDTQRIYTSYPPNREVAAAMSLFASLALLFWYVLRFMSRR